MQKLHEFYSEPRTNATAGLWYIHFLLILAFGKGFAQHKPQGSKPPGTELFVKALQLLPDVCVLHQEPIESTEILCCVALYLQALDCRSSAHNYVCHEARFNYPLLTATLDRTGNAHGDGRGHAHANASRVPGRTHGPEMSQDLVDHIHLGP